MGIKNCQIREKRKCKLLNSEAPGMTLIEMMVSLVILMLVLGAIYSILNIQQSRSTQVSRTTVMQTDAQVAFTLLKMDLLHAGLGAPYDSVNYSVLGGGSIIGLNATGLGFEANATRWSYILTSEEPYIIVRRWSDTASNFTQGDTVMIVDEKRTPYQGMDELIIANNPRVDTTIFVDTVSGGKFDTIPAAKLLVGVTPRYGALIFKLNKAIYYGGISYKLTADSLIRGNEPLLTNVEAIQFRMGVDDDGDGIIAGNEWSNVLKENPGYLRKNAIRFTMVVTSEGMPGYTYPSNSVTIENNPPYTYNLTDTQRRRKRAILSGIVYPPNLQPPD